jgi:hypothetical protein
MSNKSPRRRSECKAPETRRDLAWKAGSFRCHLLAVRQDAPDGAGGRRAVTRNFAPGSGTRSCCVRDRSGSFAAALRPTRPAAAYAVWRLLPKSLRFWADDRKACRIAPAAALLCMTIRAGSCGTRVLCDCIRALAPLFLKGPSGATAWMEHFPPDPIRLAEQIPMAAAARGRPGFAPRRPP